MFTRSTISKSGGIQTLRWVENHFVTQNNNPSALINILFTEKHVGLKPYLHPNSSPTHFLCIVNEWNLRWRKFFPPSRGKRRHRVSIWNRKSVGKCFLIRDFPHTQKFPGCKVISSFVIFEKRFWPWDGKSRKYQSNHKMITSVAKIIPPIKNWTRNWTGKQKNEKMWMETNTSAWWKKYYTKSPILMWTRSSLCAILSRKLFCNLFLS